MQKILDANSISHILDQMADTIMKSGVGEHMALIGVRTRGVPLAERLAWRLRQKCDYTLPVGSLDITFYRDDLEKKANWPIVHGTSIPFAIEDRPVLLVDDVLFTGRTTLAALRAILDLGRPSRLRLAVLIDRGHREFPIRADFVGRTMATQPKDLIRVMLQETDGVDEVLQQ